MAKNFNKYKRSGWFNERARHSLAAKGVKTAPRYAPVEEVGMMVSRMQNEQKANISSLRKELLNDKKAYETYEYKDAVIQIFPDENPEDPRNWDNLGHMATSHKRYTLGDGKKEQINYDNFNSWEEVEKHLIDEKGAVEIAPLYLYDHSGLSMKIGSFQGLLPEGHAEFDSGQVGFIYVTKDDVKKEYGTVNKENIAKARNVMEEEVKTYNQFLTGDVYGFVATDLKTGKEINSVWGFYGDEMAKEDAQASVDGARKRKLHAAGNVDVVQSRKFPGMYSIVKGKRVIDEPHASVRLAKSQIKRYDLTGDNKDRRIDKSWKFVDIPSGKVVKPRGMTLQEYSRTYDKKNKGKKESFIRRISRLETEQKIRKMKAEGI